MDVDIEVMEIEDAIVGRHYWAISATDELLIVLKTKDDTWFQVCGAWECGMHISQLDLIEEISRPKGHEKRKLHCLDDD